MAKVMADSTTKATAMGKAKAKINQRGRGRGEDNNKGNQSTAVLIIYYHVGCYVFIRYFWYR